MLERQAHAFEGDQRVGELVLDRLEAADRLAELAPLLRVVDHHLERAPRRAVRARQHGDAGDPQQVGDHRRVERHEGRRRAVEHDLGQRVGAERARDGDARRRRAELDDRQAG